MIAGIEKIDIGNVNIKKGAKVAYLDQTGSSIQDKRAVREILRDSFGDLIAKEKRINEYQELFTQELSEAQYNMILTKYCNLIEEFTNEGGYDIDYSINTVVEGLKIDKSLLERSYNDLSGGEKTLVQLAKALLLKPDLFLLDQPTNHIDIPTKEVLEDAIDNFDGTFVFISHDRYFINKFADKTIEFEDGNITTYYAGYDDYKRNKTKQTTEEKKPSKKFNK